MSYKSVRFPADFVEDAKVSAEEDFRTVPQQIQYWAELGRKQELREWQLQQMREGLKEAKEGKTISHEDLMKRINSMLEVEFKD